MAYSELVKDYERIRDYMRQFYVYGFKSRDEYDAKSARSYDNERRRVESWLGDYMSFHLNPNGKSVFLSLDSRAILHNPLYKSFKAKSFTDKDITLHFYILDILADGQEKTSKEIVEGIVSDYLSKFPDEHPFDESTVRKKLKEYEKLGLLVSEKRGREVWYRCVEEKVDLNCWLDAIAFYSEADPVGVIGSYLLDKFEVQPDYFGFKHHYILHAIDSQVLCELLSAIRNHRVTELSVQGLRSGNIRERTVYPLKIYASTQTGRQYLLCYAYQVRHLVFIRVDTIRKVVPGNVEKKHEVYAGYFDKFRDHLWGVSVGPGYSMDHIEMTIRVDKGEGHIPQRLEREKRNGRVEQIDENTYLFSADVYDAAEMLPWLRTFIGRIIKLECSNQSVVDTFYADLAAMIRMYGGDDDAVQ